MTIGVRKGRILWFNFLVGMARGVGTAVGFYVLTGVLFYLLSLQVVRNLPGIGSFIAEIVRLVELHLQR